MRSLHRPVRWRRSAIAAAGALLLGASLMTATAASAADDPREDLPPGYLGAETATSNIELLASLPRVAPFDAAPGNFGFVNSDLAFSGDNAIVGNFNGFQVYDVSDPAGADAALVVRVPGRPG